MRSVELRDTNEPGFWENYGYHIYGDPPGWAGYMRRVDAALLAQVAWPTAATPLAYVCGPTNFVEAVSQALVQGGYPPQRVKTERFGATGGT